MNTTSADATGTRDGAESWYSSTVYPEWRAEAPWVMDDMIAAQPDAIAATTVAVDAAAEEVAGWLASAVEEGEPIVVCAVGTAGHAARGVAVALGDALGDACAGRVEFRESEDQSRAPRVGGVCIVVSHGGQSSATINAMSAARASGAKTALIVAAQESASHDLADVVLQLPLRDRSFCHTIGYTTPIAAGLAIGGHYKGENVDVEGLRSYLETLLGMRNEFDAMQSALKGTQRFISTGSLTDTPSARELALDVAEASWIPASVFGVEDLLHGHLVAHDSNSTLAVILTGGPASEQAAVTAGALMGAAQHIGLRTALITTEKLSKQISADVTSARLVLPESELPEVSVTLLGAAILLQKLTMTLVTLNQTNPDLLRREQREWREAVAIGSAKTVR